MNEEVGKHAKYLDATYTTKQRMKIKKSTMVRVMCALVFYTITMLTLYFLL